MSKLNVLFDLLFVLGSTTAQYDSIATLYASPGCSGAFVRLPQNSYVPDLAQLGFDNRAYSAKIRGPWMFYDLQNYNYATEALAEYAFESSETCVDFIDIGGYSTSVKFAGIGSDYRTDSITFYEFTYFQAAQEFVQYDMSYLTLDGRISSLIVTGSSDWTIYDQPNYTGKRLCLTVSTSTSPHFVADTILLDPTFPHGSISSVRKGCFSNNIIKFEDNTNALHGVSVKPNVSFQF